ncbi:MAG: winged helix-turn-helix domain-containing protein [Fimbriimonadales bacterium]|nr:winged helix-turn-helix domain-containing protein [Fimbriimonadales bacterium]
MRESKWYFQLFGGFEARCGTLRVTRLRTAKTASLLSYLVVHPPHRFAREVLADLLWGDMPIARARNNLSIALNALRSVFNRDPDDPLIETSSQWVGLNSEQFLSDVLEFERALQLARMLSDPAQQYEQLAFAVNLYEGDFMAGFYDAWIIEKAAALQAQCLSALEQLIQIDIQRGDAETARLWMEKRVSVNPLDCDAAAQLAGAYLEARQYAAAAQMIEAWSARYQQLTGESPPASVQQIASEAQRRVSRGACAAVARPDKPLLTRAPLPMPPRNQFLGRERELDRLLEWLTDPSRPCVTIAGLGGVGKTRLALEAAHTLHTQEGTPTFWVALTAITEPRQIIPLITETLQLPSTLNPIDALQRFCAQNRPLLFLDNFEHLLPKGASVIADLLRQVPALRLCITSRFPLRIEGETLFTLTPLDCTDAPDCPALMLFMERARQVVPDFTLTESNRAQVQALCRHLDGIPLALELTAARLDMFTPEQMLERVQERLRWLRTRRRDINPRHSTMQGVLETTVAMLPRTARRLLSQLSLLPDVWTLEQACAVADAPPETLEELLALLCDASLIERLRSAPPRYRMLEVVREYAQSLLAAPSRHTAEYRLCAWTLRTAFARAADAYTDQLPHWLAFWDEARPLLLRTLDTLEQRGRLHDAVRLLKATERYWYLRPLHEDALQRLDRWLESGNLSPRDATDARLLQMRLLVETGQFQRAQPVAEALRSVDRRDPRRGWALFWVVRVAMALNDPLTQQRYWRQLRKRFPCDTDAYLHYNIHYLTPYFERVDDILHWREEGIQLARTMGDPILLGYALESLIEPLTFFGEYSRALRCLDEAQQLYTQLGDALHLHRVHHVQANCYLHQGELERAQQLLQICAEQERMLGLSPLYTRWLQLNLWRAQGELKRAQECALAEAAAMELEQNWLGAGHMLEQAALCAYEHGDLDAALRIGADAQRMIERAVAPPTPRPVSVHCAYLRACAGEHTALEELETCIQENRANRWNPALATALQYLGEACARQGELERARAALYEAIQLNQAMGRQLALEKCLRIAKQWGMGDPELGLKIAQYPVRL